MNILYFDTETTGTIPGVHEITQFAAIVEIDGVVKEEVNWRCQPTRWDKIDPKAIQTTGVSIEELRKEQAPAQMFNDIKSLVMKYIPRYAKMEQKFYPAGNNVSFDLSMLGSFWRQHAVTPDDQKWGLLQFQNFRSMDSRIFCNFLAAAGKLQTKDVKLSTICEYYGIQIDAHDALSDIRATRQVIKKMMELL